MNNQKKRFDFLLRLTFRLEVVWDIGTKESILLYLCFSQSIERLSLVHDKLILGSFSSLSKNCLIFVSFFIFFFFWTLYRCSHFLLLQIGCIVQIYYLSVMGMKFSVCFRAFLRLLKYWKEMGLSYKLWIRKFIRREIEREREN